MHSPRPGPHSWSAVLWFDLMFDVQMRGHYGEVPASALASISAYYRRVTVEAWPMNRLIAVVMLLTVLAIIARDCARRAIIGGSDGSRCGRRPARSDWPARARFRTQRASDAPRLAATSRPASPARSTAIISTVSRRMSLVLGLQLGAQL